MNQQKDDSSTHLVFVDGTNSASASAFSETTAPSDNLVGILRNWIIVTGPHTPLVS